MFGESDSESPRVPSPWSLILSPDPVEGDKVFYSKDANTTPKLSAEVEEGNVEYKLHLIHPSPARFARLVTQLKWRLLEGGGQALYELGVADSGSLIGLAPEDLKDTLDTLRSMAAEIGARVVVVKEIEVVGMGVREQDAREFAKKRRDRDKEKDKAVLKAKAKLNDSTHPDVAPASYASAASNMTSLASSLSSAMSLNSQSDIDLPAFDPDTSPSTSPSPPTLTIPTPPDAPQVTLSSELDESLALFTMDNDVETDSANICVQALDPQKTRHVVSATPSGPITPRHVFTTTPAIPIPVPSYRPITKSEKRRITRDLRRAERRNALQQHLERESLLPMTATSPLGPPVDMPTTLDGQGEGIDGSFEALSVTEKFPEEPTRMIVEAMVVRQLDFEEAFLDFTSV
ncbi:hypothetical protein OF83DRAFT_754087 [Amylostereum chailletii]|nr:hypothetical protein OF83DRAFT_754087 [Amylostereum chailletii]